MVLRQNDKVSNTEFYVGSASTTVFEAPPWLLRVNMMQHPRCAQLQLKDGSLCQGPLRASLVLAKRDMKELSAIREARGDDAVKEEASRRDADVMTSFFMTGRLA